MLLNCRYSTQVPVNNEKTEQGEHEDGEYERPWYLRS